MRTYVAAALLARTGDEGAKLAVMLLALAVATPALGGWGVACLMAPHVIAAPLIGRWIDRSRRPHRSLAAATLAFAVLLGAAGASMGRLPDPVTLVLLLATGTFGPAVTGGTSSLVRLLASEPALPRAFGLDSLTYNLAGVAGPALAATIAIASPRTATYALAGIAAAAAVPLLLLRIPTPTPAAALAAASLWGGLRSIFTDRPLALATAATSISQVGFGALAVAVPLRALATGAPHWSGWWFSAMAAGALAGSLAWSLRPAKPQHANRVVMVALAVSGAALAGAAWASDPWVITALMAAAGIPIGPQFGALQLIRDHGAAQNRAGVFTLGAGIKVAASALGTAAAGQLAGIPPTTLILAAATIPLACGLAGLTLRPDTPTTRPR